ncbi:hypothetical protein CFC21_040682 [Triticum aestivum]|uniref:Glycosyltransferase n=3 Tax=Triticum TaxID=4564 RepID=A0A9R1JT85_WHEAT|nr:cis-zeatin O-glucosyltransferase 2-like [Triticum aestivum]KAF7028820.1 hypothetical protein CFC21_040682 [Triticum aestivum]CDM83291.1 unnamed protein product [Triticum aestivum]VAH74752.1 unnamed protein product [Triticum turgidum subsp. durum]
MSQEGVVIVAVPLPVQGHLNPMLNLSLLLSSRGLDVHYAAPAPHILQARSRVQGWDAATLTSLHFCVLDIRRAYGTAPPDPDHWHAFPCHLQSALDVFCDHAAAPLRRLLDELAASRRRVVVVHDITVGFPAAEASRLPNGESYALCCLGQSFCTVLRDPRHPLVSALGLPPPPPESIFTQEFMEMMQRQRRLRVSGAGLLLNSFNALEGQFIDTCRKGLARAGGKKVFLIGPLNRLLGKAPNLRHDCLEWLDAQPPASVLYVSFGTISSLSSIQIQELATALHHSEQRFIWVLRDADRADEMGEAGESRHAHLLHAFRDKIQGRGVVITGWAPQLEILAHGATAAFMSHCGWNSILESLSHGKPILGWPMHSDQPWNAQYVCNHLREGIIVRPWEKNRETLPATAIQEVIKRAMGSNSDQGIAMGNTAKALAEDARAAVSKGGSSWQDMQEFIVHVTR